jgi:hypothetical protein
MARVARAVPVALGSSAVRWLGTRVALACATCLLGCSGDISVADGGASGASGNASDHGAAGNGTDGGNSGSAGGSGNAGAGALPFVASGSVARRLSRAEFDNTVRDLLGDDTHPASKLLPEDLYAPYDNDYRMQTASGALIDSLEALATDVATRVVADPKLRARLVPCTPKDNGDAACFRQVAENFVRRAFRRPVATSELDAYATLLAFATEDNADVPHDFYTAVELLLRSVLQDPEFLYRIELGAQMGSQPVYALDDYAIAARMSYLLWGTTPDDTLLDDADQGRLKADASRITIARRMLEDQRARDQLHRFHAMWLGYRAIPHAQELTSAFNRETTALIDRVVFDEPQSYLHIFTFAETYLDDMLAEHYGLPAPDGGEGWVAYGDSGRAGILSHGSVLSAFSKFSDTSPTQRGLLVRTRLLCGTIPRPPANVKADQPPGDKDAVCKSDRYSEHRTSSSCAGCHDQMDPIGFGLENYDIAGRYREHDEGLPQCAIAGQGQILGHGTFEGPAELGELLVDDELVQSCIVKQLMQFALGRPLETEEQSEIDALQGSFAGHDYQLIELIVSYVGSKAFALRMEPKPEMP